jgi:hypothetical protein
VLDNVVADDASERMSFVRGLSQSWTSSRLTSPAARSHSMFELADSSAIANMHLGAFGLGSPAVRNRPLGSFSAYSPPAHVPGSQPPSVLRRATLASFDVGGQQNVAARSPHARSPHTRSRTGGASPTLSAANSSHQSGLRQIFSSIEEGKEPEHEH